jgi:hypothetical protein
VTRTRDLIRNGGLQVGAFVSSWQSLGGARHFPTCALGESCPRSRRIAQLKSAVIFRSF